MLFADADRVAKEASDLQQVDEIAPVYAHEMVATQERNQV